MKTEIEPIGYIRTDFDDKFGVPRQSGLIESLKGRIILEPPYRSLEAVRSLEEFSHIWLIWQFSKNEGRWSPTVRPPRLGGNRRVGVFASRAPFRPNSLGMSCVRLDSVELSGPQAPVIVVSGIDMVDNTPIFDIKPYIPLTDCRYDAAEGYTGLTKNHRLIISDGSGRLELLPSEVRETVRHILEGDPRPGYDRDPEKIHGFEFAGYNIEFTVKNDRIAVVSVTSNV